MINHVLSIVAKICDSAFIWEKSYLKHKNDKSYIFVHKLNHIHSEKENTWNSSILGIWPGHASLNKNTEVHAVQHKKQPKRIPLHILLQNYFGWLVFWCSLFSLKYVFLCYFGLVYRTFLWFPWTIPVFSMFYLFLKSARTRLRQP